MEFIALSEKSREVFHQGVKLILKFTIFTCSHSAMGVNVVNIVNIAFNVTPNKSKGTNS